MPWYTSPSGVTCVAAYDAVGASSLADSYTNEANPGTYTAAPGVAPTWAAGVGWTFASASSQYLTTGLTIAARTWSMIIRYSCTGDGCLCGAYSVTADMNIQRFGGSMYAFSRTYTNMGVDNSGTIAIANTTGYLDGAPWGAVGSAWLGAGSLAVHIGSMNNGAPSTYANATIAALAIYSGTLTSDDVRALYVAMTLLPTAAGTSSLLGLSSPFVSGGVLVP